VTIVVGVDGSAAARHALAWAIAEAERRRSRVIALHVVAKPWAAGAAAGPFGAFVVAEAQERIEADARQLLARDVAAVRGSSGVEVEQRLAEGPIAPALLAAAAADASLLVVGSRGHGGFAGLLLGSVGQHCAQHARTPVVVVR
jgi:nucleotide-binding universal stress UspA family protein